MSTHRAVARALDPRCGNQVGSLSNGLRAWRQLNPWVPTDCRRRKLEALESWVSERTYGDANRLIVTVFGVEDGSSTDRTEPEYELGSLIPDTNVFGGGTEDFERGREAGQ